MSFPSLTVIAIFLEPAESDPVPSFFLLSPLLLCSVRLSHTQESDDPGAAPASSHGSISHDVTLPLGI